MSERQDMLSIKLKFGTWTLPMSVKAEDEYVYRQAEKLIKDRYAFYTGNYRNQSTEMYLVMTILDIAVRCKRQELEADIKPIVDRLTPLLDELESVVAAERTDK